MLGESSGLLERFLVSPPTDDRERLGAATIGESRGR